MTSETPSPDGTVSIRVLQKSLTENEIRPADLIALKGGLFIPVENLSADDVAKLMRHLESYAVRPVACGEVINVIPSVPQTDRKK